MIMFIIDYGLLVSVWIELASRILGLFKTVTCDLLITILLNYNVIKFHHGPGMNHNIFSFNTITLQ